MSCLDAAAHLARRLVGEGHGEDAVGRDMLHLHEPGDAMHQHPGLAAAGARQYQRGSGLGGHRLALRGIQGIEDRGDIHAGILAERFHRLRKTHS